jgi:hypothetical protein
MIKLWLGLILAVAVFITGLMICRGGRPGSGTEVGVGVVGGGEGSGIRGIVLSGPTCPNVRDPQDDKCADKPYSSKFAVTKVDDIRVIKEFTSDSNGEFEVAVDPGEYLIRGADTAPRRPICRMPEALTVEAGIWTETTIYCDTGIR